jgi:hypothetical protein
MSEERLRILHLIEEKKVTAEEGLKLLDALGEENGSGGIKPKWFKVRVTKAGREKPTVHVNIPFSFLRAAVKLGGKFQMMMPEDAKEKMAEKGFHLDAEGLDELERTFASLAEHGQYKMVDVLDEDEGDHVEVFVE